MPSPERRVLSLRGVTLRRGGAALLSDVDWTVGRAERWVVLGPNGAGKTTLLQIAAGRLFPTTGTSELLGERMGAVDLRRLRRRIGFASAAVAERLPGHARVLDTVVAARHAAMWRGSEPYTDVDWERARALLDQLGCGALIERRFRTLSEGERKRVQLARSLMPNPELLLLDEPAAGLDLGAREQLVDRLAALAADRDGPTLVVVTHHVEEIPLGFSHALLLRDGAVVAAGPLQSAVTAATLSRCFAVPLLVDRDDTGRWRAVLRRD